MSKLVYIVEDDPSIRELYECALSTTEFEVMSFEKSKPMLDCLKEKKCDIILLDLMLEELDGISTLKLLKADGNTENIPVIIVSAKGEETTKVKGLNLGADDYIEKPFGVMELQARMHAVLRRKSKEDINIFSCGEIVLDNDKYIVTVNGEGVNLTPKEFYVLKCLMEKKGTVVKRDRLLDEVWGTDYFGETRTLDMTVTTLRQKLSKLSEKKYIQTKKGIGYIIED